MISELGKQARDEAITLLGSITNYAVAQRIVDLIIAASVYEAIERHNDGEPFYMEEADNG